MRFKFWSNVINHWWNMASSVMKQCITEKAWKSVFCPISNDIWKPRNRAFPCVKSWIQDSSRRVSSLINSQFTVKYCLIEHSWSLAPLYFEEYYTPFSTQLLMSYLPKCAQLPSYTPNQLYQNTRFNSTPKHSVATIADNTDTQLKGFNFSCHAHSVFNTVIPKINLNCKHCN